MIGHFNVFRADEDVSVIYVSHAFAIKSVILQPQSWLMCVLTRLKCRAYSTLIIDKYFVNVDNMWL